MWEVKHKDMERRGIKLCKFFYVNKIMTLYNISHLLLNMPPFYKITSYLVLFKLSSNVRYCTTLQ